MEDEILNEEIDTGMQLTFEQELMGDLTAELEDSDGYDFLKLSLKLKSAIREVKLIRDYPDYYTDAMISKDMEHFYSVIRNVALYDYNMIGAEGESMHSENNISRTYVDRNKLFVSVVPIARI